jgi:outer membrane protein assembly factor BamB
MILDFTPESICKGGTMNRTLAILGMVAVLAGATLHANAVISASAVDAGQAVGRRITMTPPILSQAGPKVTATAQPGAPAPLRITPVNGQPLPPTAADWAEYMKDSCHSGEINANAASNLTQAWTYVTPGGGQTAFSGSPVESDSTVCFTSSDGYLYAINRNTGSTAWAPVLLGYSGYRGGTPVIWQDRVVAAMYTNSGANSTVFCRSMATGDSLWATLIPASPNVWEVYLTRPIVLTVLGTPYVFLGCFDGTSLIARILGLNMATGAIVYDQQWSGNEFIGGLATDGTYLYAPLQTTGVVKLHPGIAPAFDTVWTQTPAPSAAVMSTLVYCNGKVFAAEGAITGPESLYAINATTGAISWIKQVGDGTMGLDLGSATVDGANVYMFASNFSTAPYTSQIMAFHQLDGSAAWSTYYTTTDGLTDGGMAVTTGTNKRLYLGTGFGTTAYGHIVVLNATDGTLQQDMPYATDYIYNSVCRPFGGLYILTYGSSASGTLIGYNVNDGIGANVDVGVSAITAPGAHFVPGTPVTPACVVENFGTTPQSNIPVTCWIDSAGTHVYSENGTVPGSLAPESTAAVSFSPNWTPGNNAYYAVTMFTSLSGDNTNGNDTMKLTTVQGWMPITPCPDATDRIVHATVYDPVNDHFYMIGGNPAGSTGTYVALNDVYYPSTGTWASKAPMPTALGWEPGAYCRGNIYYLGGHNNSNVVVNTNYKYSISGDAWTTGTAVPRSRLADLEVTWDDSLIYCMGGWDGASGSDMTTVDIYDPFADAWLSGTALPTDMDMGGAGIIGDTIYIVSAVNRSLGAALANLYKGYIDPTNPTSITWIQGPSFGANATCITGATTLGTKVYWFGGFVGAVTPTSAGWCYDNTTGLITSFVPYMGTIGRNQNFCARPIPGPINELYGFAGDSACDWASPNRGYYKLAIPTGVEAVSEPKPTLNIVPAGVLSAAQPNPFRDRTLVNYSLAKAGNVSLKLYDVTGKLVFTVTNGFVTAGSHTEAIDVSKLAHGMYLLKLNTESTTSTAKLIRE